VTIDSSVKRVTGLGGIFFRAKDPKGLKVWYERHLGLKSEDESGCIFRWRDAEKPGPPAMTVWSPFPEKTDYFGPGDAPLMINYRVGDLDAVLAALEAEGIGIVKPVVDESYGKFAWINDPEGHRIELWEPRGEGPTEVDDEAAIRRLYDDWKNAVLSKDADRFGLFVTDDCVFLAPGAEPIRGGEAVVAIYRSMFGRGELDQQFEIRELRIEGNIAFVWGVDSARITPLGGGDVVTTRGMGMSILERGSDGAWRFARGINNAVRV
jgi:uncharacterized protein (TIGR02246 family)